MNTIWFEKDEQGRWILQMQRGDDWAGNDDDDDWSVPTWYGGPYQPKVRGLKGIFDESWDAIFEAWEKRTK